MKKLYFIRHGQTVMNVSGHFAGHTETPLTDEGRAQAKRAGMNAKDLKIELIVASPLSRALETAQIFAQEIGYNTTEIIVSPLLIERYFGILEGAAYSQERSYQDVEDLEADDQLVQRAHLALAWINSHDADNILVVSHGSFGRALRSILKEEYPMSHPEKLNNAELACWVEEE